MFSSGSLLVLNIIKACFSSFCLRLIRCLCNADNPKFLRSKKENGSAAVYVLAMLPAMILSFAYVYNSYQLSNEKIRLQNTADAVAYSVGAISSKDLNFKAYTNRAMVANQVAIAQGVSLQSWVRFVEKSVDNLDRITRFIPYIGAAVRYVRTVINYIEQYLGEYIMPAYLAILDAANTAYSGAQSAMHVLTVAMAMDTFVDVAQANDPGVDTGLSLSSGFSAASFVSQHNGFTERIDPDSRERVGGRAAYRMDEFRDVTLRSRDRFSSGSSRNYHLAGINNFLFRIPKAGGTNLLRSSGNSNSRGNYYTWQALDTLSLDTRRFSRFRWRWREAALGWGGAQATDQDNGLRFSEQRRERYYRTNSRAARNLDRSRQGRYSSAHGRDDLMENVGNYGGLRNYYDLSDIGLLEDGPEVIVLLEKPNGRNEVKTLGDMNTIPAGSQLDLEEYGSLHRNRMVASSKAVVYFSRPSDLWRRRGATDGFGRGAVGTEYGNLYNPFWQPKLNKITTTEALAISAAVGL